jgi:DNA-binding transcriptional MocR family regulator
VDADVARTLSELERKLLELERTLSVIGRGEEPAEPAAATSAEPAATSAEPAATMEGQRAHRAVEPPAGSRIVDESFEPSEGNAAFARQADPPTFARRGDRHPEGGAPRPRQTTEPPPLSPPSAAELLRFRERLEQTARELTHDYDELLGRLSFPAMPTSAPGPVPGAPTISFARGAPSLDIVDVEGLRDAAARAFESDPAGTTAYGTSVGYPRLRAWIAERHGVEPDRVLVTNGSMQADAFLFEHLVRPGDEVIVERPSYDRTLLSLRQRGARLHDIELQPDGIDMHALERLLSGGAAARPKLAHIIPNFQNPAGYTLSLPKRHALLGMAGQYGFLVFEDDPYIELRFSGEPLPTMLSLDRDRVVYASSFSKTVCPGIRVGYLIGPPDLIGGVAQLATNTYISPNMVAQSIVYEFCASGAIDRSIETVKRALAERAETLSSALGRELPDAEFVVPQGGYFMWVTLPPGTDVDALHHAAAERGVSFVKGTDFLLEGGENTLRLAYSGVTPEQIETGVARLAEAYRAI